MDLKEEIESTFGIYIQNDEAKAVVTVGQLHDLITRKITYGSLDDVGICLSARAFYQFRAALVEVIGIPRSRGLLSARMDEIVPRRFRRSLWRRLGRRLGWRLPPLHASRRLKYVLIPLILCFLLLGTYVAWTSFYGSPPTARDLVASFSVLAVPAATSLFFLLTRALSNTFDTSCEELYTMVVQCYKMNYGKIRGSIRHWSGPDDVWDTLVGILNQSYGVPAQNVTKDARILSDLGVSRDSFL